MDTLETVRQLAAREFELDPIALGPDTPVSEYGVDSLALIEFLFVLEDRFNVRVGRGADAAPQTLRELADLMDTLRQVADADAGAGAEAA